MTIVRERIRQMLIKEIKQIRRDPRMRAVILAVPLIQSLVFGYAVTTDEPLEGYLRVYVNDPFGNRLELMEPRSAG